MNLQRFVNDMKSAKVVESVLALAGLSYEAGLTPLDAVSEKQRQIAADVRIRALANVWQEVADEYQHTAFAQAVLRAANKHTQAQWWIERESHTLGSNFDDLDDEIEQELANA